MFVLMFVSFTGLCLERPGCECVPKKTRQVKVDIVVGVNSSSTTSGQLCSSIEIEEHRGPCKVYAVITHSHPLCLKFLNMSGHCGFIAFHLATKLIYCFVSVQVSDEKLSLQHGVRSGSLPLQMQRQFFCVEKGLLDQVWPLIVFLFLSWKNMPGAQINDYPRGPTSFYYPFLSIHSCVSTLSSDRPFLKLKWPFTDPPLSKI